MALPSQVATYPDGKVCIPIPTSSPPARPHRSLDEKQPCARDAPRTRGGAIACSNIPAEPSISEKWWLLPLSSPARSSILFSCGLAGLASLSERLPLLACLLLRQQITVFLTAATIKSLITKRDQPKSRSSGRGGELCLGSRHRSQNPSQASKQASRIMEPDDGV